MRILFPLDTNTRYPSNPFAMQLMTALSRHEEVSHIGHGCAIFFWTHCRWDVIHIHWPEALFGWEKPTKKELKLARQAFRFHKKQSLIVTTVHNYEPKKEFGTVGLALFELVYSNTDVFIHLGNASKQDFLKKYGSEFWCSRASHQIVEHGDYPHYETMKENKSLANKIGSEGHKLILVFGTLRSASEEALARLAFQKADLPLTKLVFAGAVAKSVISEDAILAEKQNEVTNIFRAHRRIPDGQVAALFKATRYVFIPRVARLNSGVIPLAFTFGVPVIGPREGVIGEIIEATQNFSYTPGDVISAAQALRAAVSLDETSYTAMKVRIEQYRRQRMHWPTIAEQHLVHYGLRHSTSFRNKSENSKKNLWERLFTRTIGALRKAAA